MIIESFGEGGRDPRATVCTRAVLTDDYGNPIAVAVEFIRGQNPDGTPSFVHQVLRPDDPDFAATVEALGVAAVTVDKSYRL